MFYDIIWRVPPTRTKYIKIQNEKILLPFTKKEITTKRCEIRIRIWGFSGPYFHAFRLDKEIYRVNSI